MNVIKAVGTIYLIIFIHILIMISITSLGVREQISAGILLLGIYGCFLIGFFFEIKAPGIYPIVLDGNGDDITKKESKACFLYNIRTRDLIWALLAVICSIVVSKYYTGNSLGTVLNNLVNDVSNYNSYQAYFEESISGSAFFTRFKYIVMRAYIKCILIYSVVVITIIKNHRNYLDYVFLVLVLIAHLYLGIARGTSFEMFEIFILCVFILFSNKHSKDGFTPILIVIVLGVLMFIVFSIGLSARGFSFDFNNLQYFTFYKDSVFTKLIGPIAVMNIMMFWYLGWGSYLLSAYINDMWLESVDNFIFGLFPKGIEIIYSDDMVCVIDSLVDIGVKWVPDVFYLITSLGIIGTAIIVFLMGVLLKCLDREKDSPLDLCIKFAIFLQMVSFPIGNFLFTSSSNVIFLAIVLVIYTAKRCLRIKRIKYESDSFRG